MWWDQMWCLTNKLTTDHHNVRVSAPAGAALPHATQTHTKRHIETCTIKVSRNIKVSRVQIAGSCVPWQCQCADTRHWQPVIIKRVCLVEVATNISQYSERGPLALSQYRIYFARWTFNDSESTINWAGWLAKILKAANTLMRSSPNIG